MIVILTTVNLPHSKLIPFKVISLRFDALIHTALFFHRLRGVLCNYFQENYTLHRPS